MTKKNGEGEQQVVVKEEPNKEVVVELDDKNQPVTPPVKPEEPKYVRAEDLEAILKKQNATYFHEQRKIQQRLEQISEKAPLRQAPVPEVPKDEWDQKIQTNWKDTVFEMARKEAKETYQALRQQEIEQQKIASEQERKLTLLEKNKEKVMQKHPEIEDLSSEKNRIFQEVVANNPDYRTDPFGPVLAMRDMEDILKSKGVVDNDTRQVVDKELTRRARTNGTQVPAGGPPATNRVVLTKDEREFCDHNGIKYENYAKHRNMMSKNERVEV